MEDLTLEKGKNVKRTEWQRTTYELITLLIHLHCSMGKDGRVGNEGVKLHLGTMEEGGLVFVFVPHHANPF